MARPCRKVLPRETLEEACARVVDPDLYTMFSLPHISQIYLFYRAELADTGFCGR